MECMISVAPDLVINIEIQFSINPTNSTRGVCNITWIPPSPINGSFYQILTYSYSSAYNVGPLYSGFFISEELDQTQNQLIFDAFYYTNYNFTITTVNRKYNITNGPAQESHQTSPTGMYV